MGQPCCNDDTKPEFVRSTYKYQVMKKGGEKPTNAYEQIGFKNEIKEPELVKVLKSSRPIQDYPQGTITSSKSTNPWFYEGSLNAGGNPNGRGALYKDGMVMVGEFSDGKAHGPIDSYVTKNENLGISNSGHFQGTLSNGIIQEGRFQAENVLYEGQFSAYKPDGKGQIKYINRGESFSGEFQKGQMHKGIYKYGPSSDVQYFDGQFQNSRPKAGQLIFKDGDMATKFKLDEHDEMIYSEMLYSNKDLYVGQFKKGQRHGKGRYTKHTNGEVYDGEFSEGLRHGKGVSTINGKKMNVTYSYGELTDAKLA